MQGTHLGGGMWWGATNSLTSRFIFNTWEMNEFLFMFRLQFGGGCLGKVFVTRPGALGGSFLRAGLGEGEGKPSHAQRGQPTMPMGHPAWLPLQDPLSRRVSERCHLRQGEEVTPRCGWGSA